MSRVTGNNYSGARWAFSTRRRSPNHAHKFSWGGTVRRTKETIASGMAGASYGSCECGALRYVRTDGTIKDV